MLANTLCHIPRVSLNKERAFWDKGIQTWDGYRELAKNCVFMDECDHHFQQRNPAFFADKLQSDQHWRLFGDFQDSVAYVDIETTGLSKSYDEITTIALYDGKDLKTYVNGQNLSSFKEDIAAYKLLVTFNGKCFDVPFLQEYFGIELPKAHIDLRYVLKRLGFSGGLKKIEQQLGLDRGDLAGVDGFFAVILWQEYKRRNNPKALETLLAYNSADVINLEQLMIFAYNKNVMDTPFGHERQICVPVSMKIPFTPDSKLIQRYAHG